MQILSLSHPHFVKNDSGFYCTEKKKNFYSREEIHKGLEQHKDE